MVLRFRLSSITTVGVLIGVVFLLAMLNEFLLAWVRAGWRWAHVLLGVLFAVGAIWAFANPINAFWALASVLGLLATAGHVHRPGAPAHNAQAAGDHQSG
jgi:hypothetical protein